MIDEMPNRSVELTPSVLAQMIHSCDEKLCQMVSSCDEKHDDAHGRLRAEILYLKSSLDQGLQAVRAEVAAERTVVASYIATPVDVTKLVLTPKIVFAIILVVISIYGTIWASTYGLGSDVRDILTRIDAQKNALEATSKLQEVRGEAVKSAIDDIKSRQESQATELQALKEAILTGKVPQGR